MGRVRGFGSSIIEYKLQENDSEGFLSGRKDTNKVIQSPANQPDSLHR